MKKRALRLILGAGYVILLTLLLLYQAGVFGERREWGIATLSTLFLGIALAAVLTMYFRVSDQIRKQEKNRDTAAQRAQEAGTEERQAAGGRLRSADETVSLENRSYEEIFAAFLGAMDGHDISERELEVAWLLYRGYTNRQIGEELYIAETTVKKHVSHIYQKLDVYSRKEFRAYVQQALARTSAQTSTSAAPSSSQTDRPL